MIGIIGAMEVEVQGLRQMLRDPEATTLSGIEFVTGTLEGMPVVLAVCGVGKVFAALCAQTMILRFGAEKIINTGVAGTLCRELGIGDVAISRDVVQHDMDITGLGEPYGFWNGPDLMHVPADPELVNLVEQVVRDQGHTCQVGTIATGDQFLCDSGRKTWIHNTFHALAGEMEGGSIGTACYVNRVPFVIIRVMSDDADGHAPENFPAFAAQAAETSIRITAEAVRRLARGSEVD